MVGGGEGGHTFSSENTVLVFICFALASGGSLPSIFFFFFFFFFFSGWWGVGWCWRREGGVGGWGMGEGGLFTRMPMFHYIIHMLTKLLLERTDTLRCGFFFLLVFFFGHFIRENSFCDFLFGFPPEKVYSNRKEFAPKASNFIPFREYPYSERVKNTLKKYLPLKVFPFPLNNGAFMDLIH